MLPKNVTFQGGFIGVTDAGGFGTFIAGNVGYARESECWEKEQGGKGQKFPSSPAKSPIYCFLLTDLHIPYFQPPGNHSANHESLFFALPEARVETESSCNNFAAEN